MPSWAWVIISWGQVFVLALPVVPLALLTRAPRLRAAYQAWACAILAIAVLALARVYPISWSVAAALTQIVLSVLVALGIALMLRRRSAPGGRPAGQLAALAVVPLIVFPLLLWGSLGSLLDTTLNLLAGLSLGLLAGVLLDGLLFQPLAANPSGPWRDLAFGALTAAITLVILTSGFGFGGTQLLLLVTLPPLGLAVAALGARARWRQSSAWLAITLLVGLSAAAVLMFVDPDELMLILGDGEILSWAQRAAWLSFGLALAAGVVLVIVAGATRPRASGPHPPAPSPEEKNRKGRGDELLPPLWPAFGHGGGPGWGPYAGTVLSAAGVAGMWLLGALVYFLAGQPGFHGDWLFVVLKDQADLSAAPSMPDRTARLSYVYTTLIHHANTSQAGLRASLDNGRVEYRPYYLVNGLEVNGGPILRLYLASQPEVDRVLDSPHLRPLPGSLPDPSGSESAPAEPEWNITSIGANRVWTELGVTGEGIVVGQSDSGVDGAHPALRDGYRGQETGDDYNWLDPWNHSPRPTDLGGHGTHTLGSAVGHNGIGVAPGAEWFGCVNLARNLANPALYLDCMQFMLAPWPQNGDPLADGDPARAAHVINNSWGCPPLEGCDPASLGPAVAALRAAGIFVVASAGNEGPNCGSVGDPIAIYDEAFSVGAVDSSGQLAFFSSRGPVTVDGSDRPKPDISAPGDGVLSSLPNDTYGTNSGTSMAGPHVVGAVALMWSANPALIGDIDRTEQILLDTARPYTGSDPGPGDCDDPPAPNSGVGQGLLDAYAAVSAAIVER
jgi:hypothetical protein